MNLKRLRGIATVALITIAAALFAGCSNSMAGSVEGDSESRMATLSLSATGIPEEYAAEFEAYCKSVERQEAAKASSRSILPSDPFDINKVGDSVNGGQSANLVFVLTGRTVEGDSYGPEVVKLKTPSETGEYDFELASGNSVTMGATLWTLTLTAYKTYTEATGSGKAVLEGRCSVDLSNGSGTAKFKMGIAGLTTPADVTISGKVYDYNDIAVSCTAGIYKKIGLTAVDGSEKNIVLGGIDEGKYKSFTYTASDVTPGGYLFIMKFYSDEGKTNIIGSYPATIVINPGNDMTITGLELDCIERLPSVPEDLKARVKSDDGETYLVEVKWTESNNATNYELNIVESADNGFDLDVPVDGSAIADGQIYGMAVMATDSETIEEFTTSDVFGNDSLPMVYGDNSCVLKLETGKVYEIQLRARNYYGVSKWANRVKSTDTDGYDAPSAQYINRMYVSYNLNGGALRLTGDSEDRPKTPYVEYHSWIGNGKLLTMSGDGAEILSLKNASNVPFESWLLEDGTAVKDLADNTSVTTTVGDVVEGYTYKNAKVKASYGNKVKGDITQEDPIQDVIKTDVKFTLYDNSKTTQITMTPDENGKNLVVKKLDANKKTTVLQVQLDKAAEDLTTFSDTQMYTNVKAEAWVGSYDTDPVETLVMDRTGSVYGRFCVNTAEAGYAPGRVLNVKVTADTKNAKGVSQTFTFRLQ